MCTRAYTHAHRLTHNVTGLWTFPEDQLVDSGWKTSWHSAPSLASCGTTPTPTDLSGRFADNVDNGELGKNYTVLYSQQLV